LNRQTQALFAPRMRAYLRVTSEETIMRLRYTGLDAGPFRDLFDLDDAALAARGMVRVTADAKPGYPCRVSLEDAEPGETLLLLPFEHQPIDSPYRASGPIFVRQKATAPYDDERLPPVFSGRILSVRAYDTKGDMVEAELTDDAEAEALFRAMLGRADVAYLHVHNAKRGCYAARVDRA
jgi:hypothetical protein